MSDTLDRLKALNSKLEAKLSEKKGERREAPQARPSIPAGENEPAPQEPERPAAPASSDRARPLNKETVLLRGQEPREVVVPATSSRPEEAGNGAEEAEIRRLAQILIHHLGISASREPSRAQNLEELARLYLALNIGKKAPDIRDLFIYKAMNISGIGLKEEDFGEIREGKYVQVIAITYEPDKNGKKKAKNISLGYFGKAETLDPVRKNQVIEFVLRWRYEKAFQNLEHYRLLLEKVLPEGAHL
jgi:hypothetical protein